MQNYRQVFLNIVTLFTLSVAELLYSVLQFTRSISPVASISHTKSETTYAQIELFLEMAFPAIFCLYCCPCMTEHNAEGKKKNMATKAKSRILRPVSSTMSLSSLISVICGPQRRQTFAGKQNCGFANDTSSNGQLTNRLGM